MRDYTTARTIFGILEFVAWVAVAIGLVLAIIGSSSGSYALGGGAGLIAAIPGLALSLVGIIAVAYVQSSRANVDTAEMTGQMLQISKEQLQLAKHEQKADFTQTAAPSKPAPVQEAQSATNPATFDSITRREQEPNRQPKLDTVDADGSSAHQYTVEHHGETIGLSGGNALWGGESFDTVDAAKEYVTSVKDKGRTEPLVAKPDDRPRLTADRAPSKDLSS